MRAYASVALLIPAICLPAGGTVGAVSGLATAGAFTFGALSHYHLGCTP